MSRLLSTHLPSRFSNPVWWHMCWSQTYHFVWTKAWPHAHHNPQTNISPPTLSREPCPHPKCVDISFPHDDHVLMRHSILALETHDPRLKEIFSFCWPLGMPKYGLGYIEQANTVISDCYFNNPLPPDIQKPSILEMHKLFTLMKGCKKWKVDKD